MSSFEPVIILYGSPTIISTINIRLPVSTLFAFNFSSLEQIVSEPSPLSQSSLHRYFIILLESIDDQVLASLKSNHRVVSIYERETMHDYNQWEVNRMINSFRQITLDLSNDIVKFLTIEGEKQTKLGRVQLVDIYYQQARVIKEWMMAFFKAESSHILIIPLNSNQQNVDDAQKRLQKLCQKLGYESTVIRQFHDYLPLNDRHSSLLPYSQLLFNNEDPQYICKLINKLSPIRFYLYGNELCDINGWTKIMIENESSIMDDEDNWIAFLENEFVDTDIKWNFAFVYGRKWKISRVSPINLKQLEEDPRFRSAVRRSHLTYAERQIEVTAKIYDWYEDCLKRGYLHIEPKLTFVNGSIVLDERPKSIKELTRNSLFRRLFSFDCSINDGPNRRNVSYIWLDRTVYNANILYAHILKTIHWQFFSDIYRCIEFIESEIQQKRYTFLIVSSDIGRYLFETRAYLMKKVFAIYVFTFYLGSHIQWTKEEKQIRGVYNDPIKLAQHVRRDYDQLEKSFESNNEYSSNRALSDQQNKISNIFDNIESCLPLPITVYDPQQTHVFVEKQQLIDALVSMPHTDESKSDMINQFRQIYHHNQFVLSEIDNLVANYELYGGTYWYARNSFIGKTINQILRSNDIDTMFKFRHILIDISNDLNQSYKQNNSSCSQSSSEVYYRGQLMSNKEFDYFKRLQGSIISIDTFLSTTTSMQVALMYAGKYHVDSNLIPIVFTIEKHSPVQTRPYADIRHYSLFPDEEETLFSMGTVFRVENIRPLFNSNNISIINLIMVGEEDYHLNEDCVITDK